MTKRSKRNKKRTSSSIDEDYIESYVNRTNSEDTDELSFKFDLIGKSSRRNNKLIETKKSKKFNIKNSPEFRKIKKLRNKLLLHDKMDLDSTLTKDQSELDIWNDTIYPEKGKKKTLKNINQIIPSVELPHPGQSYNPDPEDYKSLLNHTVNIITSNKEEESTKGVLEIDEMIKNKFPDLDLCTLDFKKKQLIMNLIARNVEDPNELNKILNGELELEEGDELNDEVMNVNKVQKRKTKTQRNKLKIIKEEKRKKMLTKTIKKMKNDVNHIKKLNKIKPSNKTMERLLRFKKFIGKLISGEVPTKISNKTFYSDPPETNPPNHINSSVKNIENPVESSINHIFKSIYRRGLLPPPPKIDFRYKNIVRKLKSHNRKYIYKTVLTN